MALQSVNQTTESIIGAAIEVHKHLGPGLLESAYEECLCHEFHLRNIPFQRQVPLPVVYKGTKLDCGYRIDLLVKNEVVVELKATEGILPIHEAQTLTYMRLGDWKVGLIINFNVPIVVKGINALFWDSKNKKLCALCVSAVKIFKENLWQQKYSFQDSAKALTKSLSQNGSNRLVILLKNWNHCLK